MFNEAQTYFVIKLYEMWHAHVMLMWWLFCLIWRRSQWIRLRPACLSPDRTSILMTPGQCTSLTRPVGLAYSGTIALVSWSFSTQNLITPPQEDSAVSVCFLSQHRITKTIWNHFWSSLYNSSVQATLMKKTLCC